MKILYAFAAILLVTQLAACNREDKPDSSDAKPETRAHLILDELQAPLAATESRDRHERGRYLDRE